MNKIATRAKLAKGNKGFSLIELIIVIAIMAALIAILAPQYLKYVEKSRVSADETTADSLLSAVKIAVADPNVSLTSDTYTVTWPVAGGALTITAAGTGSVATLTTSLTESLGSLTMPAVKSTTHKADGPYAVTIVVNTGTGVITTTGTW